LLFAVWQDSNGNGQINSGDTLLAGPVTIQNALAIAGATISVTVQPSPSGRSFSVDGTPYTAAQTFSWISGSSHTIATTAPQSGGTGIQYVFGSWSDGGAISHAVAPTSDTTYIASFTTQYYLTMNAGTGGGVGPASGWINSAAAVSISATASNGYSFGNWAGSGSGSYSGNTASSLVSMNGPITETASFTLASTRIIGLSGDLAFGDVPVGESAQDLLSIANTGSSILTVSNITYPSGFSGDWSGTIAAGGSKFVLVTFAPTTSGGYGGSIVVASDATSGNNSMAVSGTGISTNPPPIVGAQIQNNNLILSWPTNTGVFTLESTTNIASPAGWNPVSTAPTIVNGLNVVTNPMVGLNRFFRLKR
jgi:hypothetical protein